MNGSIPSEKIVGEFDADFEINFGERTIDGTIQVDTVSFGGNINPDIEENGSTSASVDYGQDSPTELASGDFDSIGEFFENTNGFLVNSDGIIANQAILNVEFDDGLNVGSGSGTSGPRQTVSE